MLVLAVFAGAASIGWTVIILSNKGMSDAPGDQRFGAVTIALAWTVTAVLAVACLVGQRGGG